MKKLFITHLFLLTICASCTSDKKLCSEENPLAISANVGIGKYTLGMSEDSLVNLLCDPYDKKSLDSNKNGNLYIIANMSFLIKDRHLQEIYVWGSFKGAYEGVDVNYEIAEIEKLGEIVSVESEYRLVNTPGIGFGNLKDADEGKFIRVYKDQIN